MIKKKTNMVDDFSPSYIYKKLSDYSFSQFSVSDVTNQTLKEYSYRDLNEKDEDGKVLLNYAIYDHNIDIVEALTDMGADISIRDKDGKTLLHHAILHDDKDIIEFLLKKEIDVNTQDRDGKACLHLAASNNHINIIKLLIEQGANINVQDKNGDTPLHLAASNNCEYVVQFFIKQEADILTKNVDNRRPIDMCSNKRTIELLSQHAQVKHKQYKMATAAAIGLDTAIIGITGTAIYFIAVKENKPSLQIMLPALIVLLSSVIIATAYIFKEQIAYKKAITTELKEVEIKQISKYEEVT